MMTSAETENGNNTAVCHVDRAIIPGPENKPEVKK